MTSTEILDINLRNNNHIPLISIITITYNAADVISPTLLSLNNQTFRDFEHIVIDGASTDNTLEIISSVSTYSKVLSEQDNGLYDAMNKGQIMAKGRYLLFLNAGDSLSGPNTLQLYADAIMKYKETQAQFPAIIYGDTRIVNSKREFIKPRHLQVPELLTFKSFSDGMLVCHQAFMIRRDLTSEYNINYRFSADYEWTLKGLLAAEKETLNPGTNNLNLHATVIDYLNDGLTDKNHKASLKERFRIMAHYYGLLPTLLRHIRFLIRHLRKPS